MVVSKYRLIKKGFRQAYFIKDNFEILLSTIKQDTGLDRHNHPHHQFGYCFRGTFNFNVEDRIYNITPDSSYLLEKRLYHSAEAIETFYALDFKYDGKVLSEGMQLNVMKSTYGDEGIHTATLEMGNAVVVGAKGSGMLNISQYKDCQAYAVVSDTVEMNTRDGNILLSPMKIYTVHIVRNPVIYRNTGTIIFLFLR